MKNLDEDVVSIENFEERQEQKVVEGPNNPGPIPSLVPFPDSLDFQKKAMQQRSEAKQETGFRRIIPTPPSDPNPAEVGRPAAPKLSRRQKGRSKRGPIKTLPQPQAALPLHLQLQAHLDESGSGAPSFLVPTLLTLQGFWLPANIVMAHSALYSRTHRFTVLIFTWAAYCFVSCGLYASLNKTLTGPQDVWDSANEDRARARPLTPADCGRPSLPLSVATCWPTRLPSSSSPHQAQTPQQSPGSSCTDIYHPA